MTKDEMTKFVEAVSKTIEGMSDEQLDEVMQAVQALRRKRGFLAMRDKSLQLKQRMDESRARYEKTHSQTKQLLQQHRNKLKG